MRHAPRDTFDVTSSYLAGEIWNHYSAGSPKRCSYAAGNACARVKTSLLTRFTGSNIIWSSLALVASLLKETNAEKVAQSDFSLGK